MKSKKNSKEMYIATQLSRDVFRAIWRSVSSFVKSIVNLVFMLGVFLTYSVIVNFVLEAVFGDGAFRYEVYTSDFWMLIVVVPLVLGVVLLYVGVHLYELLAKIKQRLQIKILQYNYEYDFQRRQAQAQNPHMQVQDDGVEIIEDYNDGENHASYRIIR